MSTIDLFTLHEIEAYIDSEKGKKTIEVFVSSLKREIYKMNNATVKNMDALCTLIDKIILSVKISKTLIYRPIDKETCDNLIASYQSLLRDKSVKMHFYIFVDTTDLSIPMQQALIYTLTGKAYDIKDLDNRINFLNNKIEMEIFI